MVLRPPALLEALKETLTAPEIAEAFVSAFERRVRERARKPSTGGDLERRLKDAETRVKNVTAGIARLPESEALYAQLATEEATTKRLRAEISQARPAGAQRVVPTRAAVRASIGKFLDLVVAESPERGREILARVMTPLTLTRNENTPGTWLVTGALRLRTLAAGVSANSSSGGAHPDLLSTAETVEFFVQSLRA